MTTDDDKQAKLPGEDITVAPKLKPLTDAERQTVDRILEIKDFDAALDATPAEILDRVTGIGTDPDAEELRGLLDE